MVWREPQNHHDDCFFAWWICLDGISERKKISIILILSLLDDPYHIALKFQFQFSLFLLDLTADEMLLEAMDDTDSSNSSIRSSSSMTAAASSLSAKPKPFSQSRLNNLVCDLGLFKKSSKILASGLSEHGILDSGTKIAFYRNRDDLLISFSLRKMTLFIATTLKVSFQKWVFQCTTQMNGDCL